MELQEGLTKENFWDDLQEKYPDAMKTFLNWIDDYKKTVKWAEILGGSARAPKFHDLPYTMQFGICVEFLNQQGIYAGFNFDNIIMYMRGAISHTDFVKSK